MPANSIYIFIVVLGSILFGLVFLYSFFLGKFVERDSENSKKAQKALVEANKKAAEIIEEATANSRQILQITESIKVDLEQRLKEGLTTAIDKNLAVVDSSSKQISESYQKLFEGVKAEFMKNTKETLGNIQIAGEQSLREFKFSLKEQQQTSVYYIQKRLNQEFESAHLEIQNYKNDQLKKVEESIDRVVLRLSEDILGKAVSLENHEKLVLESLNKAKEEGVFNL